MDVKDLHLLRTVVRQYLQSFAREYKQEILSDEVADRLFLDADNAILIEHNSMLAAHAAHALICIQPALRNSFLAALKNCSTVVAVDALISEVLHGRRDSIL